MGAPIQIRVSLNANACQWRIKEFKLRYPKQMEKAYFEIANRVRGQIKNTVTQNSKRTIDLAPLSDLRLALYPKKPFAGFFSQNAKNVFRSVRIKKGKDTTLSIGALKAYHKSFQKWQHPKAHELYPHQRLRMHQILWSRGRSDIVVPNQTIPVPREVITPLIMNARKTLPQDVVRHFNDIMRRTGMSQYKSGNAKSRARSRAKSGKK